MNRKDNGPGAENVSRDESRVLSNAVAQIALRWNLGDELLGSLLDIQKVRAAGLLTGNVLLARSDRAFGVGQHLVCLFESLDRLLGGDEAVIWWLNSENLDLDAKPIDLIRTASGLRTVAEYAESFRAGNWDIDTTDKK